MDLPKRPTVLVLAGGDPPHPDLVLPEADLVVAADSGAHLAVAHGRQVDVLVGDLDSIAADALAAIRRTDAQVEDHHPDKDATDLELALARAAAEGPGRLVLVGGHGGRLDHSLSVPGALAQVAAPGRSVEAWLGSAQVLVTADEVVLDARPGEQVSLLAWGGDAHGVSTEGLRWTLSEFTLEAGSTRGISNEALARPARVAVTGGTLVVVRPHALDPDADPGDVVPPRPDSGDRP
ncbi:thiamine diphosphokinase [soil metagenome]